jgi:hypothetical protein
MSIDAGATGTPVDLRVAASSNGDGFVAWRTHDRPLSSLWAARYRADAGTWDEPVRINAYDVFGSEFHLTADAGGNATIVWLQLDGVTSARFDAGTGAWGAPVPLRTPPQPVIVAGDAAGTVHVVGTRDGERAFDPATAVWHSTGQLAQTNEVAGLATARAIAVDESGNTSR